MCMIRFVYRMITHCERLCGQVRAFARSRRPDAYKSSRSRRDFNERGFPMAEESWSVAVAIGI